MQFCFYSIQEITSANISISDLQFAYHFPLLISDISQELPTPSYHQLLFIFYFTPFHLLRPSPVLSFPCVQNIPILMADCQT